MRMEEIGGTPVVDNSTPLLPIGLSSSVSSNSANSANNSTRSPSKSRKMTTSGGAMVATTIDELLQITTAYRPYPLFIICTMSFLWSLCALSALSPAFLAPAEPCSSPQNCTFYTIQDEFNLTVSFVVEPAELVSSVYFLGNLIVGQFFAVIADRIGRRPVVICSLLLTGIAGCLGAFVHSFPLLLVARFVQGSCYTSLTTVNYVLSGESIPNRSQSLTSIFFGVSWVLGYCFLAPMSVWFPTWRRLQFATAFPNVLVALFFMITLPESVAYSHEKNNRRAVEKWIHRNEQLSCRKIEYNLDMIMEEKEKKRGEEGEGEKQEETIYRLLKRILSNRSITRLMFVETALWIMTFMTYCALSLTSTSVGNSHPLVSFLFSGIVELPAYLFIPICLKWTKRRPTRFLCHSIGAIALLTMYFLPFDSPFHLPIWLLAKFCAACCYLFCFIFASELFPTWCRSCCIGVCSTCCNFGAIIAPHIFLMDTWLPGSQFFALAAINITCAALTCLQPETKKS